MNYKRMISIYLAIVFLAGCLIFSGGNAIAAKKTYEFVGGHVFPPGTTITNMWDMFKRKIERYSQGRLKLKVHSAGSLCAEGTCIEQLRQGAIQFAQISTGNYGAYSDNFYVFDMPYMFKTYEQAKRAMLGRIGNLLKSKSEKRDKIKCIIIVNHWGHRHLFNNVKEIRVPADLKGIKIRSTLSPISQSIMKGWGATPMNVPWIELYQSLQTKIVNGYYVPPVSTWDRKLYEQTKYWTETYGLYSVGYGFMDLKTYQDLPLDLQLIIDKAAKEAEIAEWESSLRAMKKARKLLLDSGVKLYTPTPEEMELWEKPAKAIWDKFRDKVDQEALKLILELQKY